MMSTVDHTEDLDKNLTLAVYQVESLPVVSSSHKKLKNENENIDQILIIIDSRLPIEFLRSKYSCSNIMTNMLEFCLPGSGGSISCSL